MHTQEFPHCHMVVTNGYLMSDRVGTEVLALQSQLLCIASTAKCNFKSAQLLLTVYFTCIILMRPGSRAYALLALYVYFNWNVHFKSGLKLRNYGILV